MQMGDAEIHKSDTVTVTTMSLLPGTSRKYQEEFPSFFLSFLMA